MPQHDPEWHNAQYNNRARVPAALEHLARWAQASTLARQGMACQLDQRYGQHPAMTLDVFPADTPGAPVLVFIHGGYWRALDKSDHSFVAPAFLQAGAAVVVPNYGLCPTVGMDEIALQCALALAWVWRHAASFGGDPSRIVVAGHSAGGHLAAMLLACRWKTLADDLPAQLLRGALSISGLFDLEPLRQTPFLQFDLKLTPTLVRRLSPALFPRPGATLHSLVGGLESEEFLRQNRLIRERWGSNTVPVCETLPVCDHFTALDELVDGQGRAHQHACSLLGLRTALQPGNIA